MNFKKSKIINKRKNLRVQQDQQRLTIRNIKTNQKWQFKKISQTASNVRTDGQQVVFGFPNVSEVIYPDCSMRLNSGWTAQTLPDKTMMHTIPSEHLLDNNLISFSEVVDASKQGGQIVQVLMNNNDYPIQIYLHEQSGLMKIRKIKERETVGQQLQFDALNLFHSILGVSAEILPFFL